MVIELVEKLIRSDRKAWSLFTDRAYPVIEASVRRYIHQSYITDEVQHVFELLIRDDYRLLREFSGESEISLLAYVKQIAKNSALNALKKKKKEAAAVEPSLLNEIVQSEPETGAEELIGELKKAAHNLDDKYREVMLFRIAGYTHAEIAEMLGVSINTILTRSNRAMDQLKHILGPDFFEIMKS